jgi:galactose mutarotase-like enzyme
VTYKLPRHGFARDYDFYLSEKTDNEVTFSLVNNPETFKQFPFQFELKVNYTLIENKLIISYFITNLSTQKMPFSIGAHPAFAIEENFENYSLQFENDTQLTTHELDNEQFSGNTRTIQLKENILPLTYSIFEKDALVFKEFKSKYLIILKNNNPYLKVNLESFPNLGIWTKQNAPFLCIEPWHGYADSTQSNGNIYEKEGIQILNSNQVFQTSFSIEIL